MDTTTAVTLVVLTSTSSCRIGNIDHAEATMTSMASPAVCEQVAEQIDARRSIRAFCIPTQEDTP